jgi:hypothetical protein
MKSLNFIKSSLPLAISVVSLTIAPNAFSGEEGGHGSRGGGQARIDISGVPHLRDIHDKCEWQPAWDYFSKNSETLAMLQSLKTTHWIFGDAMEREMKRLSLCTTGQLKKVNVDDIEGFTTYRSKRSDVQVGIRVNDDVYLDEVLLKKMPKVEQALTYFHETMHSFVSYDTPEERNGWVRSASFAIMANHQQAFNSAKWAITIRKNRVSIPETTKNLDSVRSLIGIAIDESANKLARFDAIQKIGFEKLEELFWADSYEIEEFITHSHKAAHQAMRARDAKQLWAELSDGVDPEFKVLKVGQIRMSLMELSAKSGNEETTLEILKVLDPAKNGTPERVSTLQAIAKKVLDGSYKVINAPYLIALGLKAEHVLAMIPQALSTQIAQDFLKSLLQAGADTKSQDFRKLFDVYLRTNPMMAGFLVEQPQFDLSVIDQATRLESESAKFNFIRVLTANNQADAVRRVIQRFNLSFFERMRLAGYARTERHEEIAKIIESTKGTN